MATIQLPPDFKEFLELLNSEKVEYLLIGGHAVSYYGYPRATGDMDVWISADRDNAEKVIRVLEQFGFSKESLQSDTFMRSDRVLQMGVPPVQIDLLTGIPGVRFAECYSKKTLANIDGVEVPLIGLDDLKKNKLASGRPKDSIDLDNLP